MKHIVLFSAVSLSLLATACMHPQRGSTAPAPQPTAAKNPRMKTPAMGPGARAADRHDLASFIAKHEHRFKVCYAAIQGGTGTVEVVGYVQPDGSVKDGAIHKSTLNNPKVEGCLLKELGGIRIPEAKVERPTRVIFPLRVGK